MILRILLYGMQISELPSEKKNLTFTHLISNLNFDEKKTDIEYISRMTESCLENERYQKAVEKYKKKQSKSTQLLIQPNLLTLNKKFSLSLLNYLFYTRMEGEKKNKREKM